MSAKKLRLAIAQINPTVGDIEGNFQLIYGRCLEAHRRKVNLVIFSELALTGYPVWDLANKPRFVTLGKTMLKRLMTKTARLKPAVILGFIDGKTGQKKSYNALAVIHKGHLIHRQYKTLLPTYDVFLEQIYFMPGDEFRTFRFKGWNIGTSICEDLWDEDYTAKPTARLSALGAEVVINISASPFHRDVGRIRDALVRRQARRNKVSIVYVNQVGAQDELIFDGRSMMASARGVITFRAPAFKEGLFVCDLPSTKRSAPVAVTSEALVYEALKLGVRDYCRKNSFNNVVIGLSGGIDSALTAVIAADALGPEHVLGVTMPGPFSSEGSVEDSRTLAENIGISLRRIPIVPLYELARSERDVSGRDSITLADENFQARLRSLELMYISNSENRLLLSTGNKSELAVGYCTLYGDMCGGLCVLGDVYKTDVYRLARYRNRISPVIPRATLEKPPSAELRPDQTDQDSLPPYDLLDDILRLYIEENLSRTDIEKRVRGRTTRATVHHVLDLVDHNEYKRRQAAPTLRISHKAWFGRRMPITNRYRG